MLNIDSHAHFSSADDRFHPHLAKPLRSPRGTGRFAHLQREGKGSEVPSVRAVQRTTDDHGDNRFLVDATRANTGGMAGIGTLNPDDPHSPALLEQYARDHNILSFDRKTDSSTTAKGTR
jgi:hypothetical protein